MTTFGGKPEGKGIVLDWETASECNVRSFEIERSMDSRTFIKIGETGASTGCSAIERSYSFIDREPGKGINFYRLRTVDVDGTKSFSPIKAVISNRLSSNLAAFPTETQDAFYLQNKGSEDAGFSIRHINGRLLESGTIEAGASLELHADGWHSGVYTVLFEKGETNDVVRFFLSLEMSGRGFIPSRSSRTGSATASARPR